MQAKNFDPFGQYQSPSTFFYLDTATFEVTDIKQYDTTVRKLYTVRHRTTAQTLSVLAYSLEKLTWEEREQLNREILVLKRVSHPNIPRLRLSEQQGNTMFLVMDQVIGAPADVVAKFRKVSISEIEQFIVQVVRVLDYLHHTQNLGHGDINPRNIFVCETEKGFQVMVLGFGNSRLDGATVENPLSVSGTPGFVPKWQACDPDLRAFTDLFGLAVTAFSIYSQIPIDQISKYVDEETGALYVPFDAFGLHWYLTQWVSRITSGEPSYSSVREAIDDLRRSKKLWQKLPQRCAIAASVGVLLSGLIGGIVFLKQVQHLQAKEQEYQALMDTADRLYAEAEARVRQRRAEERAREAQRKAKIAEGMRQMLAASRAATLNRLKNSKNCPECDLEDADLSSVDLAGANLRKANLRGAKLVSTKLEGANLSGADLTRADLRSSNLRRANFSHANLSGAILDDANATQACFKASVLSSADLWGTNMTNASFERADLETASFGFFPERSGAIDPTGEVYRGDTTAPPNCP